MTLFVLAALALTLLAMWVVAFAPRRQRGASLASRAAANADILRQQLADLERERARGLLDETGFVRAREDLQRRLVSEIVPEAAEPDEAAGARAVAQPVRFVVARVLPLAALGLYLQFGQPRMTDAAKTTAPAVAAQAGTPSAQLVSRLETQVAAAPNEGRAWVLLARLRMQRDEFDAAAASYARALDVSAKVARDPLVWCEYADALGMAAGGRLAGKPREMIGNALALDPQHPRALEMAGSAAYEVGDFRGAARLWQQLLAQLPAESSEHQQLAAAISRAERRARFSLPAS